MSSIVLLVIIRNYNMRLLMIYAMYILSTDFVFFFFFLSCAIRYKKPVPKIKNNTENNYFAIAIYVGLNKTGIAALEAIHNMLDHVWVCVGVLYLKWC